MWGDMPSMDDMQEMWDDLGVEVEMTDNSMSMTMEGMSVHMEEGPDGNRMSIIMEGASKIAAGAVALATMTLY